MRHLLLFTFFIVTSLNSFSQISQPKRFELEIDNLNDDINVMSAEENGLYLFRELDKKTFSKEASWEIIRLDTNLVEVSKASLLIDNKYSLRGYAYNNGRFVLLFQEGEFYAKDLLLVTFNAINDTYATYIYENLVPINLSEFELKDDAVIFGGDVNGRAVAMLYNFTEQKGTVLPGFYSDRSQLLQIATDLNPGLFKIVTSERRLDKTYGINVKIYTTQGKFLGDQEFDGEGDISLIEGSLVGMNSRKDILAGTYSYKSKIESSRGIFLSSLNQEGIDLQYYNYGDLENFFNYMREKKKKRIKERIKRKKIKGKRLKFRYRLFVHDIIETGGQYLLIGEAYYPTYTDASSSQVNFARMNYGRYGISYPSTRIFDGYKYTHAIIIGFNEQGKLLWDNSFEINDLKSFDLREHVHTVVKNDRMIMVYLYDQELSAKVINEEEIIQQKFVEPLKLKYENDEVRDYNENVEKLEKWYGDCFFAFGISKVKNLKDSNIDLNRKVFFINKIVVE